jgi:hypothetical protein
MFTRWIWTSITARVVGKTNRLQVHRLPCDDDGVVPAPIERRYPGLAGVPLRVSWTTPASERLAPMQQKLLAGILGLKEIVRLGRAYPAPHRDAGAPFPKAFRRIAQAPALPPDFEPGRDHLAGVALRGPFSILTRRTDDGFVLDLRHVADMPVRMPMLPGGGLAHFSRAADDALRTDWIELHGQRHAPGDAGYALAEKRMMVGLNTHITLVEHLVHCHMAVAGTTALAAFEALPVRHPLRAFLQPFVAETIRVNNSNIDGLIRSEASNMPSYTGCRLETLNDTIRRAVAHFDLRLMDPELRARRFGTIEEPGFVTVHSGVAIFCLYRELMRRYCHESLGAIDAETRAFVRLLDETIPNGIGALVGNDDVASLTLDQLAHLLAVVAYTAGPIHHVVGDMVRDYMMQFHLMPPAVAGDGLCPHGMVLEKLNSMTIAGILRYKLCGTRVPMPDLAAARAWRDFQAALREHQAQVEADPANRRYRIEPELLPSSTHA